MKRVLLLILGLILISSPRSFARLGNNEEQIATQFGKPVDVGFPDKRGVSTNRYQKGDYVILVQFLNHLSIAESYTRVDRHEFSETEIYTLLGGQPSDWEKDPNRLAWERVDHHIRAWCATLAGRPTLLITAELSNTR